MCADDLFQIHWLETVLYSPDGGVVNSPLYTFSYDPDNPPEELPEEPEEEEVGGGPEYDYRDGVIDRGDMAEEEEERRRYPPVEPYAVAGYIGVKQASGAR